MHVKSVIVGVLGALVPMMALADTTTARPQAGDERRPLPSPSVWKSSPDGGYEHLATGMRCPRNFDSYSQSSVTTFDQIGLDVGCSYGDSTATLSYYMTYRNGSALGAFMAGAKQALEKGAAARHPKFQSESTDTVGGIEWTVDSYDEDGGLRDTIWVSDLSGWTVEYRLTYRTADEPTVSAAIAAISTDIKATAGAHLAACAQAAPAPRDGVRIAGVEEIQRAVAMTSLLGAGEESARNDGKLPKADATSTCVDQAKKVGEYSLLFTRKLKLDGSDALTDEVIVVGATPPASIVFFGESLAALVEKRTGKPLRWAATLHRNGKTYIFGYFDGRPTIDQMGNLTAAIVSGAAKPEGGYSVNGKQITIYPGAN